MALTLAEMQAERDELHRNIVSGVLRVSFNGRMTEFRSLADMRAALGILDRDIAAASGTPVRIRQVYSAGHKHL